MAKMILGPLIGGLSHNSVNLWARADSKCTLYAWLGTSLSDVTLAGQNELLAASAYAGIVPVKKLKPETVYYFALSLTNKKPAKKEFKTFKTFPKPGQVRSFRFAFGSCFRRAGENPGEAFRHIIDHQNDLAFLLMLGDQVYTDDWQYNGIGKVALTREDYRNVYAYVWDDPDLRELLTKIPVYMTLDDHEVDNDWHWEDAKREHALVPWYTRLIRWFGGRPVEERRISRQRIRTALQVYWEHQGIHSPKLLLPMETEEESGGFNLMEEDAGSFAYTFYYGAAAFFVMDTRTQRVHNDETQMVLGEAQWKVLFEWLDDVKDSYPLKFIVSSSALLFEIWGDAANDRWSGFKAERDRLLFYLAERGIEDVYILVGDLHEAHAISATLNGPDGKAIPLWEFCATPFNQDTNWLAKLLTKKTSSAAIKDAEVKFSIPHNNYGVVEVEFEKNKKPKVKYIVNYQDKEWLTKSVDATE